MKSAALLHHIAIAIGLTGLAAIMNVIFSHFFNEPLSAKLNLSIIVFCYLSYALRYSPIKVGKITLLLANLGIFLICLFIVDQLNTLLLIYPVVIWLNRCLLCYSGIVAIIIDLGLCLLSTVTVWVVVLNGNGIVAALWCFLLVQTLHTLIPRKRLASLDQRTSVATDNFDQALQTAESALQVLLKKTLHTH